MSLPRGEGAFRSGGVEIGYRVSGEGPVLVAHPGGPGLGSGYLQSDRLEAIATIIYLDPRGTGRSGTPGDGDYGMDRLVEDLDRLREHLGLDRIGLLGHSHGGMVAQLYALRHPSRLSKLVLVSTVPRMGTGWTAEVNERLRVHSYARWYTGAMKALGRIGRSGSEEELRSCLKRAMPLYFHDWGRCRERMLEALDAAGLSPGALREFAGTEGFTFDTRALLGRLSLPTLVLAGRHDPVCPTTSAVELTRLIPGSRLVIFEGSGHFPFLEEEEPFALSVGAFLIS